MTDFKKMLWDYDRHLTALPRARRAGSRPSRPGSVIRGPDTPFNGNNASRSTGEIMSQPTTFATWNSNYFSPDAIIRKFIFLDALRFLENFDGGLIQGNPRHEFMGLG
jgi:hypothetical protein